VRAVQGSLKTHEDRTLFFDFLQLELGRVGGLSPKIQLYTLPGQAYYEASRKLLLRGADGVVFVADSSEDHLQGNIQFWRKMLEHLTSLGMNPQTIPVVLQCNKQDLPNAVPAASLRTILRADGRQVFEAVAIRDTGVRETLKAITREVMALSKAQLA